MRRLIISTLIMLFAAIEVHAQAAADSPEQKLAEEFLSRLNALDDWYLSVDGKEEGVGDRTWRKALSSRGEPGARRYDGQSSPRTPRKRHRNDRLPSNFHRGIRSSVSCARPPLERSELRG